MCTAFTYNKEGFYLGRNMDIEYSFGERIVITPRKYQWKWREENNTFSKYALIGMANVTNNYPLYAEVANEKGLVMASLNYPNNAKYLPKKEGKINLAPYEFMPYILTQFQSVDEAMPFLENINLINEAFMDNMPLAPLHYILADKFKSVVIEQNDLGFRIYDNKSGVLTNNPDFPMQMTNLQNYMNLSIENIDNSIILGENIKNYGQGLGMFGLPGDVSPMSRFVRCCFYKNASLKIKEKINPIVEVLRILDSVAMIRGSVLTKEKKLDITAYSCCIDLENAIYYFKTYDNIQIHKVELFKENLDSNKLIEYSLPKDLKFIDIN